MVGSWSDDKPKSSLPTINVFIYSSLINYWSDEKAI